MEDRLGNRAQVATDFVPGAGPSDILLVHMGVAFGRVEETPCGTWTNFAIRS
ncbi:MAG: hypothetical protein M3336_08750 [Chloroflexota bacterium]|nr:hypothetical protein [Chloroflexota bacterium]